MQQDRKTESRPLTARSLVASLLLGTVPPDLPGQRLVRVGERFGFSETAIRVALSRMVGSKGGVFQRSRGSGGWTS